MATRVDRLPLLQRIIATTIISLFFISLVSGCLKDPETTPTPDDDEVRLDPSITQPTYNPTALPAPSPQQYSATNMPECLTTEQRAAFGGEVSKCIDQLSGALEAQITKLLEQCESNDNFSVPPLDLKSVLIGGLASGVARTGDPERDRQMLLNSLTSQLNKQLEEKRQSDIDANQARYNDSVATRACKEKDRGVILQKLTENTSSASKECTEIFLIKICKEDSTNNNENP
ncbi:MAG: hypothetical protein OXC40_07855 [Proteobacteria bacterium]|nr:hypothetical protein [Pseudomonadota bacterium]